MPIVRKAYVACDRCDAFEEFDSSVERPLSAAPVKDGMPLAGWVQLHDGTCLCPDCQAGYFDLQERQKRELREFLGKRVIELEI